MCSRFFYFFLKYHQVFFLVNFSSFHIQFELFFSFDRPCENMILTLTGFEDRDRDWVKEMIKLAGAKYTSYFTRHNHAIICKR